jgi:hypothetical protein
MNPMPFLHSIATPAAAAWLAVAAVFAAAGVVKGVIGLGLPTLSMALLALWMPPVQAAALLIVPSFVTNVWQLRPWSALGPVWRRVALMQLGIFAGTLGGALLFGAPAGAWATLALGVALIGYAAWGLAARPVRVSAGGERWLGPMAGALTGVVTAFTGVFVVPAVAYLQALNLPRDALIQAMGISFTTSTVALGIALAGHDNYSGALVGESLAMLIPALAGMAAGQWIRARLSLATFRRIFFVGLILLGLYMIGRQLAP